MSGLDWTGFSFWVISWIGLDWDQWLVDLDWTGSFQLNLFHTLVYIVQMLIRYNTEIILILIRLYFYTCRLYIRRSNPSVGIHYPSGVCLYYECYVLYVYSVHFQTG